MPTVTSHEVEIYYETHGQGPTIVFLHGGFGNHLSWWQQFPHFSRNYQVINLDQRGFGLSPCASENFDPLLFGDDLLAVLDAEGIACAALVCQSMSGWAGVQLCRRVPERVSALVLSASIGGADTQKVRDAFEAIEKSPTNPAMAPTFAEQHPDK